MSDMFDQASDREQMDRDALIHSARLRAQQRTFRADCGECGEDLESHRQQYGTSLTARPTSSGGNV